MKNKIAPFVENIAESAAACLLTMVQGNLLLLGASHWIAASQTGLFAGAAAATAVTLTRTGNRLIVSITLGLLTAIVDYFVHPASIGTRAATEAVITGAGAALLSYAVGFFIDRLRRRRALP